MITLKSNDSGSSFQVCNDGESIGYIRMQRDLTGEKYLASVIKNGDEDIAGKQFDSPQDALEWIKKQR